MRKLKLLMLMALCAGAAWAQGKAPVPPEYQDLYSLLQRNLSYFDSKLSGGDSAYPVNFGAELYAGDAAGRLLEPGYYDTFVTAYLDQLQALNVKAVKVAIGFPILYRPFHESFRAKPGEYEKYLAIYKRLATDIHRRGLKMIAHSQLIHPEKDQLGVGRFFTSLNFNDYQAGRSAVIQTIARELRPDYLIIQTEPSTEFRDTKKQEISDLAGDMAMLNRILSDLRAANLHTTIVGAGIGTWQPKFADWLNALVHIRDLDLLDIHIYPIAHRGQVSLMTRIIDMADAARAAGKKVGMSEAWLYKQRDGEMRGRVSSTEIYARDSYSFWAPLDQEFMRLIVKFARAKRLEYVSFFNDKYFFTNLDYDQVTNTKGRALEQLSNQSLQQALKTHKFTDTGLYYKKLIASTGPLPPVSLENFSGSPRESVPSVDNGVEGRKSVESRTDADRGGRIDGEWESDFPVPGGRGGTAHLTMDLRVDGDRLSGSIHTQAGKFKKTKEIQDGKVDGNRFTFTTSESGRNGQLTLQWEGTANGDTMSGSRKPEGAGQSYPFTARRK